MADKYLAKKAFLLKYLEDSLSEVKNADAAEDSVTILTKFAAVEITFPDLLTQFDELNLQHFKGKNNVPDQSEDYSKAMNMYGVIKALHTKHSLNQTSEKPLPTRIKLPPIEIPYFNGDPSSWQLFKESFLSLVHTNHELTPQQKVQYLISKLQGKASHICAGISCVGENYEKLWAALVTRYDDPRSLATVFFNKMMAFQSRKIETPEKLTEYLDEFCSVVESLKSLKLDDLQDFILLNIALSKLPSETVRAFETAMVPQGKTIPTYSNLTDFVTTHIQMLKRCDTKVTPSNVAPKSHFKTKSFFVQDSADVKYCSCCKKANHALYRCDKFLQLSPQDRYNVVRSEKLCLNCLNNKHIVKNCTSQSRCSQCSKPHHSLLHFEPTQRFTQPHTQAAAVVNPSSDTSNVSSQPSGNGNQVFCSTTRNPGMQTVLLSTVKVKITDSHQNTHVGRFLLDSGSQSNFITADFCKQIGLHYDKPSTKIHISGMDSLTSSVLGKIDNLELRSIHDDNISYAIDTLVVKSITDKLPTNQICPTQVKSLSNLRLADDTFDTPGQIHGLLGAAFYPYIVLPGNAVDTTPDGPRAINTTFGYVVIGNAKSCSASSSKTFCGFVKDHQSLENIVKRFWEDEEVPSPQNSIRSKDELEAEAHFKETCTFDKQISRYIVRLPFKKSPDLLGNSVNIAKNRFLALERKLERNSRLKENYTQAINELLVAEHLIPCPNGDETDEDGYYVPHHCIVKESSLTTKYRIVFDFSCRTSNGVSLNDLVYSGPKLYTDLFEILLNFRLFEVALVADVARMFLQVLLHPEDTKYQKIFWRKDSQEPLQTYFLSRVTFGLSTSPFLVQRVIHQLAMDKAKEYPLVKPVIESAFYMDDLTLSLPTTEHALEVQHQLIECFKSANFDLVKWSSNNPLLLESIPPTSCLSSLTDWNPDESLKILGMYWNNNTDQFSFGVTVENSICTKRNVLSNLAKIWDPLGLISPVTVHCKILLQSLWKSDLSWDSPAPQEIADIWTQILRDLQLLSKIQIPRHIAVAPGSSFMLIGYCDASEKAFGAVIYSRVQVNDKPVVTLLAAKSKVAPLKQVSIPRLELNAALLLARLLSSILNQYTSRYPVEEVVCLSDSTIALHWINASPHKWQTYVANRVTKIQELIPSNKWYHVTTHNNTSADCLSRGLLPSQLLSHPTWFAGPPYLIEDQSTWPITTVGETTTPMPEEKNLVLVTVVPKVIFLLDFAKKYSSWSKILHILVYVYRFLKVLTTCSKITIEDLKFVELKLLLAVQDKCFGKDFQKKYASLSPFKDDSGLIRVGGRLSNSNLPFENKHPILLPKEEYITRLLVVFLHETNLHTGPALLLAIIRQKYWILAARPLVRQVVHECNFCFKIVPHNKWPKMGDLPRCRVEEVKPWVNTGVDHAGPFTITLSKHRGNKTSKAYLCLFVCLTTTAIHLEVTSDLSKEAFLNALKRFLSRRGPISTLFSDNGGAFVASKNHLNELYSLLNSSEYKEYFGDYLLKSKIQWKMLPARAPHMGGIWERAVRKVKSYLPKLIGDQILTFEEICTVAIEVEGMINATPLCVLSSDPNELEALTPAHFIKLTSLQSLPAVDVSTTPLNRLTRYKLLDNIFQNMWKRYRVEYLTSLQERSKWRKDVPNIEVGTVVLLKEDNVPAMHWPLGIVVEVFPSKTDGIVRSASVKTKTGTFKRPVVKLCPLPTQ